MKKIDYEVDDFINYYDYKGLSKKSIKNRYKKIKGKLIVKTKN